jgi:drug/metabolite transporter (DMT)-like permease
MRPIIYGILASVFFSLTFIMNQSMNLSGGSWMWSASLRFIFMIPFLLLIVMFRGNLVALLVDMKKRLWTWIGWSLVGFGLMYAPVCYAAEYEPGWLIAGTWQVTIVAGSLLSPLFYKIIRTPDGFVRIRETIPIKGLIMSFIILFGVGIMQVGQIGHISLRVALVGIVPVIIAAFAYPLGNRKMMEVCEGRLDVYQRVLGMTLASLPLWLLLAFFAFIHHGPPSAGQINQSLIVAVSAGIVATVLFFSATGMVKGSTNKLAAVEATQAGEVLFTAIGELLFLSVPFPSALSWTGMFLVIAGMILHSLFSGKDSLNSRKNYNRSFGS